MKEQAAPVVGRIHVSYVLGVRDLVNEATRDDAIGGSSCETRSEGLARNEGALHSLNSARLDT